MIRHNDCFPCFYYRNIRDERIECAHKIGTYLLPFGNPKACEYWSPEPGCDYEPETRETKAIEEVKAAIKRFEEGKDGKL